MGKRKLEDDGSDAEKPVTKKSKEESKPIPAVRTDFRANLFDSDEFERTQARYAKSEP